MPWVSNCSNDGVFIRQGSDADPYPDALEYRVTRGTGQLADGYLQWPAAEGTLAQNATNYLYVEDPDGDGVGAVASATTGFPAGVLELFVIDTLESSVSSIDDRRACLMGERAYVGDADLNFETRIQVKDAGVNRPTFDPRIPLSDLIQVDDSGFSATGLAGYSDTISIDDSGFSYTLTTV